VCFSQSHFTVFTRRGSTPLLNFHRKEVAMLQLHYERKGDRGCTMEFFHNTGTDAQIVKMRLEKRLITLCRQRVDAVLLNENEKVGEVEAGAGIWWYDPVVFDV
jgi:hypothetical protein